MLTLDREYIDRPPPKSTGREVYNAEYVGALLKKTASLGLGLPDIAASVTWYTAETVRRNLEKHGPGKIDRLVVSGGGAYNPTLMGFLKKSLPQTEVVTGEALGIPPKAKEAVAFAVLANETLHGICNNAPGATGASKPVIMGKISL
jgi:anhydro-N-acetylmuramic acid kinase